MTGKEYLKVLADVKVDKKKTEKIALIYAEKLPEIILKIVSNAEEPVFLEDGYRVLSYAEIIDAEKDLHIGFKGMSIIPLVDCGENDFVVYNFNDNIWSKFNIIDETFFKKKNKLEDLLK